ncbi:hypothetical protein Tco_1421903 [Tanacetum coccineum]
MYKEYLAEFWYFESIGAHYLPHSREYVAPPSIDIVRPWFEIIGYRETVPVKGTLKKSIFPPRWRLLMALIIQCLGGKTRGFDLITNKDAIILYSLANGINIDYASIFWEDIIIKLNKRHREKVIPYTRFLSLLMIYKMKEGYGDGELTFYPTKVFSVNNWALKPNQPEEPLFTNHMLAICSATEPVVFKAPKPFSNAERVSQGTKLRAKPGHKNHSTSSKQPSLSSKEETKGRSSKAPTSSKIGHSKKRKESSLAMDLNPSQPLVSTLVDTGMHKEDQHATGGSTSLGVTSEVRANPQLSSGMSAFNLNEPIYSASFILYSESTSGNDASTVSITEADPGKSAPSDFVPQQQGMNEGTKNTSYDHLFAGIDPHVLADKTQSISEGLEIVLTQPTTGKWASSIARQVEEDETSRTIKLEDLKKLVSSVQPSFKDLDSPEDDPIIVVDDSDEDKEAAKVYATTNSQKHKLELEKNKAKAEATLLKAQPFFPNVGQLNELLVKSLQTEFSKILSAHDFSSLLPTKLKDLPSKFKELNKEVKGLKQQVHELEIELPGDLKEIPSKLEDFTKAVTSLTSQVAELKTLPLLNKVTNALNRFAQAIASKTTGDISVPSAGQAGTKPTEGEKNTNQATISQLFQRKSVKNANLTKQQSKPTSPPTTPIIPLIITTTT